MALNPCGSGGSRLNRNVPFAEIVISQIQRDCSLKVFILLAKRISQPAESAAVHPQRVILVDRGILKHLHQEKVLRDSKARFVLASKGGNSN